MRKINKIKAVSHDCEVLLIEAEKLGKELKD